MANIDLLFRDYKKAPIRHRDTPNAWIELVRHSQDREGTILLSPQCKTPVEVETWADELIKELQAVKKKARTKFGRAWGKADG